MKNLIFVKTLLLILSSMCILTACSINKTNHVTTQPVPDNALTIFKNQQINGLELVKNDKMLRERFAEKFDGKFCGLRNEPKCLKNRNFGNNERNNYPGIIFNDLSVMMFSYNYTENAGVIGNEISYGKIYYDLNGNNKPDELCKDRFVYNIYKDRISLDSMLPCNNSDEPTPFLE